MLRLEKNHQEQTIVLNDEQIRLLERFSPEFREHHIEVHYTGERIAVDTFAYSLKRIGEVYLQAVWVATTNTPEDDATAASSQ
ncbi:TPA: hypothetical protein I8303_001720 [Aeromonas hydrophila]|nr:hypothetical protein [Aeromonas hydrophila]